MTTAAERQKALQDILEQRVLILDGAMGTMLQQRHLTAADFGGSALERWRRVSNLGCKEGQFFGVSEPLAVQDSPSQSSVLHQGRDGL